MIQTILEILQIGVKQYGALFSVVAFVCFILWYVLRWVQTMQREVIAQAITRETEQRQIIVAQIHELKAHRKQISKVHKQEVEDHRSMTQSLQEVEKALGRLNGYKKP